jgi:hypothetical protein
MEKKRELNLAGLQTQFPFLKITNLKVYEKRKEPYMSCTNCKVCETEISQFSKSRIVPLTISIGVESEEEIESPVHYLETIAHQATTAAAEEPRF